MMRVALTIAMTVIMACVGWFSYANLRLRNWDDKVRELCAKEGGVKVLLHIPLSAAEFEAMPRVGGHIAGHAPIDLTPPAVPTYGESVQEVIREATPRVWKTVSRVRRKSDGVEVAHWVTVTRLGGDPIPIDHPSSFTCPPAEQSYADLEKIFVKAESK